jgi:hypothetical protein
MNFRTLKGFLLYSACLFFFFFSLSLLKILDKHENKLKIQPTNLQKEPTRNTPSDWCWLWLWFSLFALTHETKVLFDFFIQAI